MEKKFKTLFRNSYQMFSVKTKLRRNPSQRTDKEIRFSGLTAILEHMFTNAKKILITTEKHEVFVIRKVDGHWKGHQCPLCGGFTDIENLQTILRSSPELGEEVLKRMCITRKTRTEQEQIQGEEYE